MGRVKAFDRHCNMILENVKEMWSEVSLQMHFMLLLSIASSSEPCCKPVFSYRTEWSRLAGSENLDHPLPLGCTLCSQAQYAVVWTSPVCLARNCSRRLFLIAALGAVCYVHTDRYQLHMLVDTLACTAIARTCCFGAMRQATIVYLIICGSWLTYDEFLRQQESEINVCCNKSYVMRP